MLGNGRVEAYCFDGKKRLCHIRGKMRKKQWVNQVRAILIPTLQKKKKNKQTTTTHSLSRLGRHCVSWKA